MTDLTKHDAQNVRKYSGTNKISLSSLKLKTALPGKAARGVIILADISGSMSGEKKRALVKTLTQVWRPGLQCVAFESELWEIEQKDIETIDTMGTTNMLGALEEAWTRKVRHIVLLTDGQPDQAKSEILAAASTHDVPIDTVGIGTQDGYGYDPEFLRELSATTGGKYTPCNEPVSLPNVVEELLLLADKPNENGGTIAL